MTRVDPADIFSGIVGSVREPKRMETGSTTVATEMQQRMRVRLFNTSVVPIVITTGTDTVVGMTGKVFDTAGLSGNSKITIPSGGFTTGTWIFHAHVSWIAPSAAVHSLWIRKNGAAVLTNVSRMFGNAVVDLTQDSWGFVNDPLPGDYFEAVVRHETGANNTIFTGNSDAETYFEAYHGW